MSEGRCLATDSRQCGVSKCLFSRIESKWVPPAEFENLIWPFYVSQHQSIVALPGLFIVDGTLPLDEVLKLSVDHVSGSGMRCYS